MGVTTPTARAMISFCASWLGTREEPPGSNRQPFATLAGHPNGQAWCATFLVAGLKSVGVPLPVGADTPWTPGMERAFEKAGLIFHTPRPGDVAFIYYRELGRVAHVALVERVDGDYVVTVEGNTNLDGSRTGVGVYRHRRRWRGRGMIVGFGRPAYAAAPAKPAGDPQDRPQDRPHGGPSPALVALRKISREMPHGLRPDGDQPSARGLQELLNLAGISNFSERNDHYGPKTSAGVARFHNAYPQFRSAGKQHDPAIGPRGWRKLYQLAEQRVGGT